MTGVHWTLYKISSSGSFITTGRDDLVSTVGEHTDTNKLDEKGMFVCRPGDHEWNTNFSQSGFAITTVRIKNANQLIDSGTTMS